MKKIYFIFFIIFAGIISIPFYLSYSNADDNELELETTVYKSQTCGCCGIYTNYLKNKGVKVNVVNAPDINLIKRQYNVPSILESCHTTIIGDYFVEGHVPIEAIKKLVGEKPDILGIGMPGMPSGSPGMPGKKIDDFVVYGVRKDESQYVFMTL